MRRCRTCVRLVLVGVVVLAMLPPAVGAQRRGSQQDTREPTTVVVREINVEDDSKGINASTILQAGVSALAALAGAGVGYAGARRIETKREKREDQKSQVAEIDALVSHCNSVVEDLLPFGAGDPSREDVVKLTSHLQAVQAARPKAGDQALDDSVEQFLTVVTGVLLAPRESQRATEEATRLIEIVRNKAEEAKQRLGGAKAAA